MIIDAQAHLWGPNTPERPWAPGVKPQLPEPLTADILMAAMDDAGVDRVVIVTPGLEQERNDLGVAAAQAYPDRFAVMGRLSIEKPGAPAKLEEMLEQPGMLGVRQTFLRESGAKMLREGGAEWLWEASERQGFPIMVYGPGLLPEIGEAARAHPGVNLIIDHLNLSDAMVGTERVQETVDILLGLASLKNISVKVSALPCYSTEPYPFRDMQAHARRIIEQFGPKRCFWGSDYSHLPCSYRQTITMFTEEMPFLSADDLEWIMGRALAEKIGWPMTP